MATASPRGGEPHQSQGVSHRRRVLTRRYRFHHCGFMNEAATIGVAAGHRRAQPLLREPPDTTRSKGQRRAHLAPGHRLGGALVTLAAAAGPAEDTSVRAPTKAILTNWMTVGSAGVTGGSIVRAPAATRTRTAPTGVSASGSRKPTPGAGSPYPTASCATWPLIPAALSARKTRESSGRYRTFISACDSTNHCHENASTEVTVS